MPHSYPVSNPISFLSPIPHPSPPLPSLHALPLPPRLTSPPSRPTSPVRNVVLPAAAVAVIAVIAAVVAVVAVGYRGCGLGRGRAGNKVEQGRPLEGAYVSLRVSPCYMWSECAVRSRSSAGSSVGQLVGQLAAACGPASNGTWEGRRVWEGRGELGSSHAHNEGNRCAFVRSLCLRGVWSACVDTSWSVSQTPHAR